MTEINILRDHPEIGGLLLLKGSPGSTPVNAEDLARGVASDLWAPVAASIARAIESASPYEGIRILTLVVRDLERFGSSVSSSRLCPEDRSTVGAWALALHRHYCDLETSARDESELRRLFASFRGLPAPVSYEDAPTVELTPIPSGVEIPHEFKLFPVGGESMATWPDGSVGFINLDESGDLSLRLRRAYVIARRVLERSRELEGSAA